MRSPRRARHPATHGAHKTRKAKKPRKKAAHVVRRKAAHHKAAQPATHAHRVRKH